MVSTAPAIHRLTLEGELTVRDAELLHARLCDAVNAHALVEADCSAVTLVDVCMLQLLLSAHRTARQCGKRFVLAAPPDGALKDALVRCGIMSDGAAPVGPDATFWCERSVAT